MLAHLFPSSVWAAIMIASSCPLKGSFLTLGLSWFSHLVVGGCIVVRLPRSVGGRAGGREKGAVGWPAARAPSAPAGRRVSSPPPPATASPEAAALPRPPRDAARDKAPVFGPVLRHAAQQQRVLRGFCARRGARRRGRQRALCVGHAPAGGPACAARGPRHRGWARLRTLIHV